MRKFILSLGVAALTLGALTSCNKSDSSADADKPFNDSLAVALGEFVGMQQNQSFDGLKHQMDSATYAKMSKKEFLEGVKAVLMADTSKMAYFQGMQIGMQLMQPVNGLNREGISLDPDVIYKAFENVFMQDSVSTPDVYYANYQTIADKLQQRMQEKQAARLRESKEYKDNTEAGKAYIEKVKKEGYTQAPSGIVYKIDNPGDAKKVKPTDKVSIRYKGMKTDGKVFDQTKEKPYLARANAFIPGFNEALTLVGKGGKYTVVIPGELAYGDNGAGGLIGPNETLIFEVEVIDAQPTPDDNAPAPKK